MKNTSAVDRAASNHIFDDFDTLTIGSGLRWQNVNDGATGTIALDATGGTFVSIPTAAALSDYQLIATQVPLVVLSRNKSVRFECRFKVTEANTNASVLAFGLSSTVSSGFMQATTSGPPATFTGAVFYKVSGGLSLGFRTSVGTANTDNPTFATLVSGTVYTLGLDVNLNDATTARVVPDINGKQGLTSASIAQRSIEQTFTYTGGSPLYAFAVVKAGSASAETLSLDYIGVDQLR